MSNALLSNALAYPFDKPSPFGIRISDYKSGCAAGEARTPTPLAIDPTPSRARRTGGAAARTCRTRVAQTASPIWALLRAMFLFGDEAGTSFRLSGVRDGGGI